jgi:hypothetical protein
MAFGVGTDGICTEDTEGLEVGGEMTSEADTPSRPQQGGYAQSTVRETEADDDQTTPVQPVCQDIEKLQEKSAARQARKLKDQRRKANRASRRLAEMESENKPSEKGKQAASVAEASHCEIIAAGDSQEPYASIASVAGQDSSQGVFDDICTRPLSRPHSPFSTGAESTRRPLTISDIIRCELDGHDGENWEWIAQSMRYAADEQPHPLWASQGGSRSDHGITGTRGFGAEPCRRRI